MNQYEMKQRAYQSNLKSRALQVLLYLIDRSNKEQTCFPAVPTIGKELHISISTVKRAMKELVDAGHRFPHQLQVFSCTERGYRHEVLCVRSGSSAL